MNRTVLSLVAAALGIAAFGCERVEPASDGKPKDASSDQAPGFSLQDVEGKTVSLSRFAGKVVILDFWATWCPPCREEIPHFIELQNQYRDQGLVVIGVSVDGPGSVDQVAPFSKRVGINYPVVFGSAQVVEAYGPIDGIPTTFVIDREGRIREKFVGYRSKENFEKVVRPLLGS